MFHKEWDVNGTFSSLASPNFKSFCRFEIFPNANGELDELKLYAIGIPYMPKDGDEKNSAVETIENDALLIEEVSIVTNASESSVQDVNDRTRFSMLGTGWKAMGQDVDVDFLTSPNSQSRHSYLHLWSKEESGTTRAVQVPEESVPAGEQHVSRQQRRLRSRNR
eukprot:ANDGO_01893.mRNA.1 hypothetical protein